MVKGRLNDPKKMARLAAVGVEVIDPHTWQSVSARIPFSSLTALRNLEFVHWVGYARPEQKLDPRLTAAFVEALYR